MPTSSLRNTSIMALARRCLPDMTPSERAVAEALLNRPEQFVHWSIDEAVNTIGVSTATIARLCRTLQCSGFKELKIQLAAEIGAQEAAVLDIKNTDSLDKVAKKVIRADLQAVQDTLELLDGEVFLRAVEVLAKARRTEVYGIGSSTPIAHDAYYRFLKLGLPVVLLSDPHIQVVSASQLTPQDAVLIVSHTGRTEETLAAARLAREAGATLIAITSFHSTPLTRLCDLVLITSTAESIVRAEAMASRIAHLALIDALSVALSIRLERAATISRSQQVIENKRLPVNTDERNTS